MQKKSIDIICMGCSKNLVDAELLANQLEANGYESAGPMFNIYHVSPHETQNPDEFVTEICYPVKKR